jgi:hypothetical protein
LLKRISFKTPAIPLALLLLGLLSFAPIIPRLGVYWDDWPSLWFLHSFGPGIFPAVFAIDRPLQGWLFILTTSLVGESMIAWQLFGILTRWLSALAMWWAMRSLWPRATWQVTWVALLFIVYPGFAQQYIPFTYSHMYLVLSLFFVSLGAMIWAQRKPGLFWPLTLFALISSVLCWFTLEYFIGLELLRPAILWLVFSQQTLSLRQRARRVAIHWAPYLLSLGGFAVWRALNKTPRAEITIFANLQSDPAAALARLGVTILNDLNEGLLLAWGRAFNLLDLLENRSIIILVSLGITLLAALLTAIFMLRLNPQVEPPMDDRREKKQWARQAIGLGLFALLASGWPFWVTNLRIELVFPWDRFTLAMMPGVSLLLVGLVELITRKTWQTTLLLAIAAGFAAGLHFQTGLSYMRDWNAQKDLFWQLAWRIPGLQPGSTLMTSELPFAYATDNSLTAPLNWMYAPENASRQMPYLMHNVDARLGTRLPSLAPGTPIRQKYRATEFNGNTSQSVVFFYSPPRCLKVMDPEIDRAWLQKPLYVDDALPLSDLNLILPEADPPAQPPSVLGPEPVHSWCYYFEKAELARQQEDWQEVARLGDQALALKPNLTRDNIVELTPFIEGYARSGQWQQALDLTLQAYQTWPRMQRLLCTRWLEIAEKTSANTEQQDALAKVQEELKCLTP